MDIEVFLTMGLGLRLAGRRQREMRLRAVVWTSALHHIPESSGKAGKREFHVTSE